MLFFNIEVTDREQLWYISAFWEGNPIPRPRQAGRQAGQITPTFQVIRWRSTSQYKDQFSANNVVQGLKKFRTTRLSYVHLLMRPCVRAEKAAWGWDFAISLSWMLDIHDPISDFTYSSTNCSDPIATPRYGLPLDVILTPESAKMLGGYKPGLEEFA